MEAAVALGRRGRDPSGHPQREQNRHPARRSLASALIPPRDIKDRVQPAGFGEEWSYTLQPGAFMPLWRYLALALTTASIIPAVHALRRRTSLVNSYAAMAFLAFAGWVTPHSASISIGGLAFGVASTVFFGLLVESNAGFTR
jgi:hypothetical protein